MANIVSKRANKNYKNEITACLQPGGQCNKCRYYLLDVF